MEEFRIEKKLIFDAQLTEALFCRLKINPLGIVPNYPARSINNIYFDNPQWDSFFDSASGFRQRCKMRLRWYGAQEDEIGESNLEIKHKTGEVGWKQLFPLVTWSLSDLRSLSSRESLYFRSGILGKWRALAASLFPVIRNQYHRHYFKCISKPIRVTLDEKITYCPFSNYQSVQARGTIAYPFTIIEVKYPPLEEHIVRKLLNSLPGVTTKSSKYVTGIQVAFG